MKKDIQALWRAMGRAEQLEQVDAVLAGNPDAAANLLSDWKLFRKDCDNKKIPDDLIVAQALALKDKVLEWESRFGLKDQVPVFEWHQDKRFISLMNKPL